MSPGEFQRLFETLIKYYTRVKEAVSSVEEIWIFLVEAVFGQQLKGELIFEQLHKQLFKKEVLAGHRYVQAFLKEIRESFTPDTPLDSMLGNINEVLL